jgi:imidazolonepropionase-like amidohydrolase
MLLDGIANIQRFADATLAEAVASATSIPAAILGKNNQLGTLAPGREASLILFRWHTETRASTVVETILAGRTVYRKSD